MTIIEFFAGFTLLATAIRANSDVVISIPEEVGHRSLFNKLDEMARTGQLIDGIFRLNSYISEGGFGAVFKGERYWDNRSVALKFVKFSQKEHSDAEFAMYTYLNAVDNDAAERFGFPSIYYYKVFDQCEVRYTLMAISLLTDGDLYKRMQTGRFVDTFEHQTINGLILFRDFVLQSKYMHSCGIKHNDIKPDNIMLRGARSFLIDFNVSSKMLEHTYGGTTIFYSRGFHRNITRVPKDDWESFLYGICYLYGVPLKWFQTKPYGEMEFLDAFNLMGQHKNMPDVTMAQIRSTIKPGPLLNILLAFGKQVFELPGTIPDYDGMYKKINDELRIFFKHPQYALFTWLTPAEQVHAIHDLTQAKPLPDIVKDIKDPNTIDFKNFQYKSVDLEYFSRKGFLQKVQKMATDMAKILKSGMVINVNLFNKLYPIAASFVPEYFGAGKGWKRETITNFEKLKPKVEFLKRQK